MKKILVLLAIVVIGIAANSGYRKHQKAEEAKAVAAMMQSASRLVIAQVGFFKEDRGVTYKEAIAAAEKNTLEIGASIQQVQAMTGRHDPALVAHGEQYLKAAQESTRRTKALILAKAEMVAAYNGMVGLMEKYRDFIAAPRNEAARFHADVADYSAEDARRRTNRATDEFSAAAELLGKSLSELLALRAQRPKNIPEDSYVAESQVTGITIGIN